MHTPLNSGAGLCTVGKQTKMLLHKYGHPFDIINYIMLNLSLISFPAIRDHTAQSMQYYHGTRLDSFPQKLLTGAEVAHH